MKQMRRWSPEHLEAQLRTKLLQLSLSSERGEPCLICPVPPIFIVQSLSLVSVLRIQMLSMHAGMLSQHLRPSEAYRLLTWQGFLGASSISACL